MNIPIVGQTFEIDGYKSIECTADANADAKAFAKANGIPFAEAKYILETLYGSARQEKVTEGVTNTTADEDGEVDGTDDEIMDAIDNLTTALADNENIDKSLVEQLTALLTKLTGGTATTNNTDAANNVVNNTNNTAGGDWDKLEVEGKGVNLNNVITLVQDAVAEYDAANGTSNKKYNKRNYTEIYNSFSAEEKAVIDKFIPGDKTESKLKNGFKIFLDGGATRKDETDRSKLAFALADSDGDGFLTDTEINDIAKNMLNNWDNLGAQIGKKGVCSTTINGEKVYFVYYPASQYWGSFLALTEKEFEIMDKYFNDEDKDKYVGKGKSGEDIQVIWEELGAEYSSQGSYGLEVLTNSAGVTSAVFDNGAKCSLCDDRLYDAYKKVRNAIAEDNNAGD